MHNDDISSTLILSRKSTSESESQMFQAELDKYRPFQQRLLQAQHKQIALLKEITRIYGTLLQHKQIKSEQAKYEAFIRQRNLALAKYRKIFQAFNDLSAGVTTAHDFYSGMKEIVSSLQQNVETFVENRRSEGGQLLARIERDRLNSAGSQADQEQDRLKGLMQRMSMSPAAAGSSGQSAVPDFASHSPVPSNMQAFGSPSLLAPPHRGVSSVQISDRAAPSSKTMSVVDRGLQDSTLAGTPPLLHSHAYNEMRIPYQPPASVNHMGRHHLLSHDQSSLPPDYVPPPPPPGPPPESEKRNDVLDQHRPPVSDMFTQHRLRPDQDRTPARHYEAILGQGSTRGNNPLHSP